MAHDALALEEIDAFYGDSHVLHRVSLRLGEGRLLGLPENPPQPVPDTVNGLLTPGETEILAES